jgi:hypothetical protein
MKYSNYIGILAGVIMLAVAFMPWVYIPSVQATITGFGSETNKLFGKPALMNAYLMVPVTIFFLLPVTWAKRINPFLGAINFAWALRNLFLLSTCRNGECPEKTWWLYVYVLAAFVVLVMTVLPDMKVKSSKP